MADMANTENLKRTQLYALNVELGGKIVPFAGYEMPVQYPQGVLIEEFIPGFDITVPYVEGLGAKEFEGVLQPVEYLVDASARSKYNIYDYRLKSVEQSKVHLRCPAHLSRDTLARLRAIFATLMAGDPFHPDNVLRLRVVGAALAGLELVRYAVWMSSAWLIPGQNKVEPNFSLTAWFSVLVVFVLAEVFREGARLRREAELTI